MASGLAVISLLPGPGQGLTRDGPIPNHPRNLAPLFGEMSRPQAAQVLARVPAPRPDGQPLPGSSSATVPNRILGGCPTTWQPAHDRRRDEPKGRPGEQDVPTFNCLEKPPTTASQARGPWLRRCLTMKAIFLSGRSQDPYHRSGAYRVAFRRVPSHVTPTQSQSRASPYEAEIQCLGTRGRG